MKRGSLLRQCFLASKHNEGTIPKQLFKSELNKINTKFIN